MDTTNDNRKQGFQLILSGILIGLAYEILTVLFNNLDVISSSFLFSFSVALFNALFMGILAYLILKNEFFTWFKHFSVKWILIGIPLLFVISTLSGSVWSLISNTTASNSINSILSWGYIVKYIPFMLLGEELLSISILYGAWKKLNWRFWQASLLCAILFSVWHLTAYDFNLLQCLVTIIPARLMLNYLFKKTNSIWVTLIVHIAFDVISFLPILLK